MRITFLFFSFLTLTACGYKGPLYLPTTTPSPLEASAPATSPNVDEALSTVNTQEPL